MLNLTQPTLSGQVKALEGTYGIQLFQRQGRGIELTETGRRLFGITRRLYDIEGEAEQLLAGSRSLSGGQLRVGADAPSHVIALIGAFHRRHPQVQIKFSFGNSRSVLADLLERRSEIGVLANLVPDPRIYAAQIYRDRLVIIVYQGHPWTHRRSIRLADLEDQPMVLREPGSATRAILEAALAERRISPQTIFEIGSREAVREAVAARLGIGVVLKSELGPDLRLQALEVADANLEAREFAACLHDRRPVNVVRAFFELVNELAPIS
jgi:aminoethylphosphonate catabolism LysR family transcriptional regulator